MATVGVKGFNDTNSRLLVAVAV